MVCKIEFIKIVLLNILNFLLLKINFNINNNAYKIYFRVIFIYLNIIHIYRKILINYLLLLLHKVKCLRINRINLKYVSLNTIKPNEIEKVIDKKISVKRVKFLC